MDNTGQPFDKPETVSMEEILNSIRQAIGDNVATQKPISATPSQGVSGNSMGGNSDILELVHPIGVADSASSFPLSSPSPSVAPLSAPTPTPIPAPHLSAEAASSYNNPSKLNASQLVSDDSYSSISNAFRILSKAVEAKQSQEEQSGMAGQTVDEVMKEIMRPFIRDWLNQNLPMIVERLVSKEIERLAQSALSS